MTFRIVEDNVPMTVDGHGRVRIAGTRVSLDSIIIYFNQGYTAEDLADSFPAVSLDNIKAVLGYYRRWQDDVDEYLRARREEAEKIQTEIEAEFNPIGFREWLFSQPRHVG